MQASTYAVNGAVSHIVRGKYHGSSVDQIANQVKALSRALAWTHYVVGANFLDLAAANAFAVSALQFLVPYLCITCWLERTSAEQGSN